MTAKVVLLFPSIKGNVSEKDINEVEAKLDGFGIEHFRIDEDIQREYDAVIALGGDGTMLKASSLAYTKNKPIMCINFGTLGYMSCLEKSELDMLSMLKSGFSTDQRMMLDMHVLRGDEIVAQSTALNEALVARPADGDIARIELKCDGATVCDYRADGLIISTPTGSSAYAMSAGGPIIDTKLDAFVVCSICPHSLGARALVFSANSRLEAIDMNRSEGGNLLISDGKTVCELKSGDRVIVTKSDKVLEMIKLKKDAFYETLYNKMS